MAYASRPGERRERLPRVALLLLFVLLACLALRQVSGGDVGFHLEAGEYVLDGNGWPADDPFTYTVADHPYVDTSWGYQVVLASLQRTFGAPGMVLFHTALVLLTLWLVYCTIRLAPADPVVVLLLLLLGVLAGEMRYEVRPETLSYAFLAFVLYLTQRHVEGLRSPLWLLPPTFLLWVNSHSLFVLGWIALGCCVLGLWLRDRRPDRKLVGWSAASVAIAFVNPYGWRAIAFPLTLATRFEQANVFNQSIGEFKSPFALGLSEQFPFFPQLPLFSFRVLFVLLALAMIPLVLRKRWCSVLLFVPFAYLSFKMVRNIPLLVVTGLPAAAWSLSPERVARFLRLPAAVRRQLPRVVVLCLLLVTTLLTLRVYNDAYYVANRRPDRFGVGWNELTQPVAAVEHAERTGLHGPVLNHLNFGGYLMWARSRPVFIDGRLEVIGEEFFDEYRRILADERLLEAAVSRYGIEWIVFPFRLAPRLLGRLSQDRRWTLSHVDPLAAVFVRTDRFDSARRDPGLAAILRPAGPPVLTDLPGLGDSPRSAPVGRWLAGFMGRERFPTEPFYLGLFHYWRGDTPRAITRFAEATRISNGAYYETYLNLGSALYRLGRFTEAEKCYRIVLAEAPDNRLARERLEEIGQRRTPVGGSGERSLH